MKVLIVGYFDILHSGHILTLQMAKTYGDHLVVGIGSDEVCRQKKGNSRPILSERERAFVVKHIDCVDEVVCINPEGSYDKMKHDEEYLELVKPDVFIRSKTDDDIKRVCKKRGVRLVCIPNIVGIDKMHSTDIIEKIKHLDKK